MVCPVAACIKRWNGALGSAEPAVLLPLLWRRRDNSVGQASAWGWIYSTGCVMSTWSMGAGSKKESSHFMPVQEAQIDFFSPLFILSFCAAFILGIKRLPSALSPENFSPAGLHFFLSFWTCRVIFSLVLFWGVFFWGFCVYVSFLKKQTKHKAMKCTPEARQMDYKRGWGEAEGLSRAGEREVFSHVQVLSFRWSSTVDPFGFSADTVCSKAVTIWEGWTAAAKCRRYGMLWYCVDLETL